ncbi:ABC transporter permease [Streptomyces sp. NPDC021212]|uniref:ABC transporter permease n=1 Tax=Streptomyces sp. NPDC021212 TaxID=3365118 RepID=UPI003791B2CD
MTAPLTPHDQPSPHDNSEHGQPAPGEPAAQGRPDPYPAEESEPAEYSEPGEELRAELVQASVVAIAVAVAGVGLGLLWLWLAPRVGLISDGKAVYLKNSEGEDAIGADGVFVLAALAFGLVSALLTFLFCRRGGVALVVGLAIGGVLGSVIAWRIGVWLGPSTDVVAHARQVGKGVAFQAPLKLNAKGALLAWSVAAMVVHLALTGLFGPRDEEPETYYQASTTA